MRRLALSRQPVPPPLGQPLSFVDLEARSFSRRLSGCRKRRGTRRGGSAEGEEGEKKGGKGRDTMAITARAYARRSGQGHPVGLLLLQAAQRTGAWSLPLVTCSGGAWGV